MDWETRRAALQDELGETVTLDDVTGGWKLLQREAGHRHSIDDVLTADAALRSVQGVKLALDLGTGIGGVGLLVLWALGEGAEVHGVEAQELSHRLLLQNVEGNGLTGRYHPHYGDLRDFTSPHRFPLVTGSPPYFPRGTGVLPADSQKAHARFELRGDVSDYARAAARLLTPDGRFVFCFPTVQRERALKAAAGAGLPARSYRDVIPREGLAPLFTLVTCGFGAQAAPEVLPPLIVRDAAGRRSEELHEIRARFGFTVRVER